MVSKRHIEENRVQGEQGVFLSEPNQAPQKISQDDGRREYSGLVGCECIQTLQR